MCVQDGTMFTCAFVASGVNWRHWQKFRAMWGPVWKLLGHKSHSGFKSLHHNTFWIDAKKHYDIVTIESSDEQDDYIEKLTDAAANCVVSDISDTSLPLQTTFDMLPAIAFEDDSSVNSTTTETQP